MTDYPTKAELRKVYRALCQTIPAKERHAAGVTAAQLFSSIPEFASSTHVACYLAQDHEFDTNALIEMLWQADKHCYLPIMVAGSKKLRFVRYRYGDALQRNAVGILEPAQAKQEIAPEALDIVLTPLLAFDREGHRLGTGGGYYDATFSELPNIFLLGVGFALQEAPVVPSDAWDVRLRSVLTEKEVIKNISL